MGKRGNPNIKEITKKTRFTSTNQPKNNGRKPSRLKAEIEEKDISIQDVRIAFKYILDMNEKEIDALVNDKSKNFLLRCLTKAFKEDYEKGNLNNTQVILDRIFGKAKEYIEHSGLSIADMTPEERIKRIKELEIMAKERAKNKKE